MLSAPFPELDELLHMMGQAGRRLSDIGACEGAAGNISIFLRWPVELETMFPVVREIPLPNPVPEMEGATFLVSGSGTRLREILDDPPGYIGCIAVQKGGKIGSLHTTENCHFERVTSEFNSHLAVHYDQMLATGTNFHALIHAQPVHLTYLSHIPCYQDENYLNTHLLRWQPETIINLPEGIGFIEFRVPGSPELMAANVESLSRHSVVIWAKHGVMAGSDISVMRALDRIEYAETAAKYEVINLSSGEAGEGLSVEEIRRICRTFDIKQNIY